MGPKKIPLSVVRGALVVLLIALFSIKLFFLLQQTYFEDSQSYYHVYQIESVAEMGLPSYVSEYHYNQKRLAVPPGYYFITGFLYSVYSSITLLKVFDALLLVAIIYVVYLLGVAITGSVKAGFFASLLSAVMPLLFMYPQNILRPLYLSVLLILIFFYVFIRSNSLFDGKESFSDASFIKIILILIFLTFVIGMLGSHALFLVISMVFYISFKIIDKSHIKTYLRELAIFTTLVTLGSYFLIYRGAFAQHGIATFWNNVPFQYYRDYLGLFSITNSLGLMNVVIALGGFYAIYHFFTEEKYSREKQHILFCSAGVFAALILALISTGNPEFIFFMAGIMLSLCFATYVKIFISHANSHYKFNLNHDAYWVVAILIIVVLGSLFNLSLLTPSSVSHIRHLEVTPDLLEVLKWTRENTAEESIIFATPEHGHLIGFFAQRKYILDSEFLFVHYPDQDVQNIDKIYAGIFTADAPFVINQYFSEIDNLNYNAYVLFDDFIRTSYSISHSRFIDGDCFTEVYAYGSVSLYKYGCPNE